MKHLILLTILVTSQLRASTITHTHYWTKPISQTGWSTNVSLPQFNPSLGYLINVTVSIHTTNLITIQSYDLNGQATITVGNTLNMTAPGINYSNPNQVTASNDYVSEGFTDEFYPDESLYIGCSSVPFNISTSGYSLGNASGNWSGQQGNYLGATLCIRYCYEPRCDKRWGRNLRGDHHEGKDE